MCLRASVCVCEDLDCLLLQAKFIRDAFFSRLPLFAALAFVFAMIISAAVVLYKTSAASRQLDLMADFSFAGRKMATHSRSWERDVCRVRTSNWN